MKNFNYLAEMVSERGIPIGKMNYIIGKEGDLFTHPKHWQTKEIQTDRTLAQVLVINQKEKYLEWKMVYCNSKGFYIKKDNYKHYFTI